MAYCDKCGNFDAEHTDGEPTIMASPDYQPDLYYYWDSPIEEDYNWRCALPDADCLCEICSVSYTHLTLPTNREV